MKVMLAFPPLPTDKGTPLLSQNRQFQWFSHRTVIYPVVMASAATLVRNAGLTVLWKDGIAEGMTLEEFHRYFLDAQPEVVVMETKTPVIRQHWQMIGALKQLAPGCRFVLVGDHVTAFPEESLRQCPALDFVVTGGDYDVSVLQLAEWLQGKGQPPKGLWYREDKEVRSTGAYESTADLETLPWVDRELTKFHLYQEFNILRKPFAYTMAGRDCPYHRCTFCSWTTLYPRFRVRSPQDLLDEVGHLLDDFGVREIFDDTGTFPSGKWLETFCNGMITRGYHRRVLFSCNFRFDYLQDRERARLMKKAGFRLLKAGLESANQATLDRIRKGISVEDIVRGCRIARDAGLAIHLTMMVGWPWETREEALNTLNLAKRLMTSGLAEVLQATLVVPYPGTPLYQEAVQHQWLRIAPDDYERYDMSEAVLVTPDMEPREVKEICERIYKDIYMSPQYFCRQLMRIRSLQDVRYSLDGAKAVLGHIRDFSRRLNPSSVS